MQFEWFAYDDAARMARAFALRVAVFVDEQGFAEADERDAQDASALHVLGVDDAGAVCCTARMFPAGAAAWHVGRVAVRRDLRGQGVGRLLMDEIARKARTLGGQTLELGAQIDKQGFYAALGFVGSGAPFLDAGYPHILMKRAL